MHTSAQTSQEDRTSVMSKMKRSMTILAGRPISESGMTERSSRVRKQPVLSHFWRFLCAVSKLKPSDLLYLQFARPYRKS